MLEELVVLAFSNTVDHLWCVLLASECPLDLAVDHLEAIRIEQVAEVALFGRWVFARKEAVVETYLRIDARLALYPVDSRFSLAVATFGTPSHRSG